MSDDDYKPKKFVDIAPTELATEFYGDKLKEVSKNFSVPTPLRHLKQKQEEEEEEEEPAEEHIEESETTDPLHVLPSTVTFVHFDLNGLIIALFSAAVLVITILKQQ